MISQNKRVTDLCNAKLKAIKMGDVVGLDLIGPAHVVAPDPNGQPSIQVGWDITIWLKHNKLLGQSDIGLTLPMAGVLPPDEAFTKAVEFLLEKAREMRHEYNNPTPPEVPAKSDRPTLPAGLVGKVL